jgi:DNA polymerase III delta prime subunit
MKFYETHYEEYLYACEKYNIHPELISLYENFPKDINDFGNLIIYGPPGVGKYTQVLKLIKKYSQSQLKYDKKIKIQSEKQTYIYRMSDIHYEIDMSLLGCNSKILWNELFLQIVDIVSMKQEKKGFIVCKNFHFIHTELLEIFYSYIQQYNHEHTNIQIRFIIMTEHISFIPNNILNCCKIISMKRPSKKEYMMLIHHHPGEMISPLGIADTMRSPLHEESFTPMIQTKQNVLLFSKEKKEINDSVRTMFSNNNNNNKQDSLNENKDPTKEIMLNMSQENITNIKEIYSFSLLENKENIPSDLFNIICDNIIKEMENHQKIVFSTFRDTIYDILIYNLDVSECLWYILNYFIKNDKLKKENISEILVKTHMFLKYYNNNYRPIYHLENIFYFIINKMYGYSFVNI